MDEYRWRELRLTPVVVVSRFKGVSYNRFVLELLSLTLSNASQSSRMYKKHEWTQAQSTSWVELINGNFCRLRSFDFPRNPHTWTMWIPSPCSAHLRLYIYVYLLECAVRSIKVSNFSSANDIGVCSFRFSERKKQVHWLAQLSFFISFIVNFSRAHHTCDSSRHRYQTRHTNLLAYTSLFKIHRPTDERRFLMWLPTIAGRRL